MKLNLAEKKALLKTLIENEDAIAKELNDWERVWAAIEDLAAHIKELEAA